MLQQAADEQALGYGWLRALRLAPLSTTFCAMHNDCCAGVQHTMLYAIPAHVLMCRSVQTSQALLTPSFHATVHTW